VSVGRPGYRGSMNEREREDLEDDVDRPGEAGVAGAPEQEEGGLGEQAAGQGD
jgi:hypothetical protein